MSHAPSSWRYGVPPSHGDCRKLVTLEDGAMVWVGIRHWNEMKQSWMSGLHIETARVLGWIDLPSPADEQHVDPGIYWGGVRHA